jgi:CspA family cold shock protein
MDAQVLRGTVKFFKPEKGWGGIESQDAPGDVWVHQSVIEMPGFRALFKGQDVEFRYEAAHQDSWNYRATWVRPLSVESEPG